MKLRLFVNFRQISQVGKVVHQLEFTGFGEGREGNVGTPGLAFSDTSGILTIGNGIWLREFRCRGMGGSGQILFLFCLLCAFPYRKAFPYIACNCSEGILNIFKYYSYYWFLFRSKSRGLIDIQNESCCYFINIVIDDNNSINNLPVSVILNIL